MIWFLIVGGIIVGTIAWFICAMKLDWEIQQIFSAIIAVCGIIVILFMLGYGIYNWSGAWERDFNFRYQAAESILNSDNDVVKAGNITTMQGINEEILKNRKFVGHPWRGAWANRGIAELELLVP